MVASLSITANKVGALRACGRVKRTALLFTKSCCAVRGARVCAGVRCCGSPAHSALKSMMVFCGPACARSVTGLARA